MNAPERIDLPDVQLRADIRDIAIDAVGVKGLRSPLTVRVAGRQFATVATWSLSVALAATTKGTHMSRFIELVECQASPLDAEELGRVARNMLTRLGAERGTIDVEFPYFVRKPAPVSAATGLVDYDVRWRARAGLDEPCLLTTRVLVPVTTLCPCSKEIAEYGAHNQRSHVTIEIEHASEVDVDSLIAIAERSASCEVYGLLKRVDEKYVTERAYDNPRFAEDLVRDMAVALDADPRVRAYVVEAENFESIHNHSATARVVGGPRRATRNVEPAA